ncbi:hypothetical protein LA080_014164 [Diaporthe eres]|nr:hypothetical protein LA080_014164 [Diaporthe eres]
MATQPDAATAHNALFMVLPPEVRNAILTAAFGGRTIHIQQYYPAMPKAKTQGSRSGWARGGARQWLGGLFAKSKSMGKRGEGPRAGEGRRWYACVCDRYRRNTEPENSPAADNCLFEFEESRWNGTDPPDVPADLAIGAMGWLLICRQAYQVGLGESTVRDVHQAGRSCEVELGLPWFVYNQYQDEVQKDPSGRTLKVGTEKCVLVSEISNLYHLARTKTSLLKFTFHSSDEEAAVMIATWDGDQWVSYDNTETLHTKVQFANTRCLGGTMVWAIDLDDGDADRFAWAELGPREDSHFPRRI